MFTIVVTGTLAGTLVGFLGGRWWVFDLMANLRLQFGILLALGSVPILWARRCWPGVATIVGAGINLALVLPFLGGSPGTPGDGETLDITFFNTKIEADVPAVIAHLASRDDDVVVLAATSSRWGAAMMASDLPLSVVSGSHLTSGLEITVLTRDPDVEVTIHEISRQNRDWSVEVVVDLDDGPVHILGTHPVSPMGHARAQRRDLVLGWIGHWAEQREASVVVVGDLNATPWSAAFRSMVAEGRLVDSQRTQGLAPSWPAVAGPLGLPIDHVLHSDDLTTLHRELGPSFGSDHRMVHARLAHR